MNPIETETHPFAPFLPPDAVVLFLGTFPARPHRWSMHFYYPNFANDFWRIMGLLFHDDPARFELRPAPDGRNRWDETAIRAFCTAHHLAFSDTAEQIHRRRGNASDADLEVLRPRDVDALLAQLPRCQAIATTGGKASEILARLYDVAIPSPGAHAVIHAADGRTLPFWRLPSTSRAYPLPLAQKATPYRHLLASLALLPSP